MTAEHPVFGVLVPAACPGVPERLLDPRSTWADAAAYDARRRRWHGCFSDNFERFAGRVSAEVAAAGPHLAG